MNALRTMGVLMLVGASMCVGSGPTVSGPTVPGLTRDGADEVLALDGLADPARWGPSECTVEASKDLQAARRATLHMHIPVDHKTGEKNYPIGWPRAYLDLKPPERTWNEFERFEFLIYAKMSRPAPPKQVLSLQIQCPDRQHAFSRNLAEIRLGEWVRVSIPLHEVGDVGKAARLGLNISERDYRHGDTLDFYLGAFRLARAAELGLASLAVDNRAVFADRPMLKLTLDVVGPTAKIGKGLPLTVRRDGKALASPTVPVRRGLQTVWLDASGWKLAPGEYAVSAFDADPARRKSATFRVVEGPWQEETK